MKYGCIGEKLGHSFSVDIHKLINEYEYVLAPMPKDALDAFMMKRDFSGINVTIPYKRAVMPYLEKISDEAALCGAVNTIINDGGKLYGFNTDFLGMRALIEKNGIEISGKNVLILGSGGTSGTASALCRALGAGRVERVSRTPKDDMISYETAAARVDTDVIINTTPCGMFPNLFGQAIDISVFPRLCGVVDAVYNPLRSQLVLDAKSRGIKAAGGLYMLVSQATYAAEIFTGKNITHKTDEIYDKIVKEKENIVLIGMPGSGKSTIGKKLAEKLGFEFIDTDDEIIKLEGREIKDIFSHDGEGYFREKERDIIRSVAAKQSTVIATGGGAILSDENVRNLKMNGKLIFIDAPLNDLAATSSRPLSSDRAALEKRYHERYGRYEEVADITVPVSRDLEKNLDLIERKIK